MIADILILLFAYFGFKTVYMSIFRVEERDTAALPGIILGFVALVALVAIMLYVSAENIIALFKLF